MDFEKEVNVDDDSDLERFLDEQEEDDELQEELKIPSDIGESDDDIGIDGEEDDIFGD